MLGEDAGDYEGTELEQEALAELGNILLNNCLATIANQLNRTIQTDIPQAFSTKADELSGKLNLSDDVFADSVVMLVNIDFSLRESALQGHLIFLIDMRSTEPFLAALQSYIEALI
jgi:chemotaxis protein CheC